MKSLDILRSQIDVVDKQILSLLAERASLALEIGEIKKVNQQSHYQDTLREEEVIARLASLNDSALTEADVTDIYKAIMRACLQLQNR